MDAADLIGNLAAVSDRGESRGVQDMPPPAALACHGMAMSIRALLVTAVATALTAAGCGTPALRAHHHITASASVSLTRLQACERLLADVTHNGGTGGIPDIPALRNVADHVTAPRLAADARTAVRDIEHTGIAPVALTLLRADCAQAGVKIPAP
jgi:hypothetical protein